MAVTAGRTSRGYQAAGAYPFTNQLHLNIAAGITANVRQKMFLPPSALIRVFLLLQLALIASCAPMGFSLANVNPKTRGDVVRVYKSVVAVEPPDKFSSLDVSGLTVDVFEESRSGKLQKTESRATLSKVYLNKTMFHWRVNIAPNIWRARGYRLEFSRSGDPLFGVSADFRYEFISPYDY